jgi:hypothetical protein
MRQRLLPAALTVVMLGVAMVQACDTSRGHHADPIRMTAAQAGATPGDVISFSGYRRGLGPAFSGVGAISGGGGNTRLLIDYLTRHRRQVQQILDYLFKPGYGASLQMLKIEIGGDANATDGAEPSYQHSPGKIDCGAGYELWLARQAQRLNPGLVVYALQWNAPHWVSGGRHDAWTAADIRYVIGWLKCARSRGVRVSAVGGWNEHLPHGVTLQVINWFIALRAALNRAGFRNIRIVAVDSYAHAKPTDPDVSAMLAGHPRFRAAVGVLGYHNICAHLSRPQRCHVPWAARASGDPIWETELGALQPPGGLGSLARSINDAYIRAHVTGIIEWPMVNAMPPDLPSEDLGLVRANQPWSGNFSVSPLVWAIAQTTQFTRPGWRYLRAASRQLGSGGSVVGYEAPDHRAWSVVAQTSDATAPQTIALQVLGGLPDARVNVWSTDLNSASPSTWFVRQGSIRPRDGLFRYRIYPGFIYTFTTTTGQAMGAAGPASRAGRAPTSPAAPAPAPMPVRYSATRDQSGEPWGLAAMDGAFEYLPGSSTVFGQAARGMPDFWQPPRPGHPQRYPYAVLGGPNWRDYTISVKARFTGGGESAGLIARYRRYSFRPQVNMFEGYEFTVTASGAWQLTRVRVRGLPIVLAAGRMRALGTRRWHTITLAVHGHLLVGRINGRKIASVVSRTYQTGIAGICTGGWYQVLFRGLTVTR